MDLKVRQLEVFKAVMETGSVTSAAARLHCTQPAVSVALAKFEASAGLALFDRSRGRFAPTPEAELIYEEVDRGLAGLGRVVSKIRELGEGRIGHLSVAADGEVNFLPAVIAEFQRDHSDVSIDVYQRTSKDIVSWAGSQQLDVGIVEMPVHWPGVAYEPFTQACVCIMPADHRLAERSVITPADLDGEPLIGIATQHPIDVALAASFAAAGRRLTTRLTAAYFATCRRLVRCGAGLAVVDAINGDEHFGDGVVGRPFEPTIRYEMAIVTPARQGPSPLARMFVDSLRSALEPYRID